MSEQDLIKTLRDGTFPSMALEAANMLEAQHRRIEHLQGLCDSFQKVIKQADEDIQTLQSKGQRLALELECLLMDTKDTAIQSKWWGSAHEALEEWRK